MIHKYKKTEMAGKEKLLLSQPSETLNTIYSVYIQLKIYLIHNTNMMRFIMKIYQRKTNIYTN